MDKLLQTKQKEVENIITFSQNYDFPINCENYIHTWYENKKSFIEKMFGGNTFFRTNNKVEIKLSTQQKIDIIDYFINHVDDYISMPFYATSFYEFISANGEGFFDNVVMENSTSYPISKGMKLSKSFKYFIPNEIDLRAAQDFYSRCVQKDKIEGYLYLSVDPVDYLTLSENNENWRSCHALDGDYRAGNLSYMLDKTTIIAYLASDQKENLKNLPFDIPWFSKKWRMLIHINEGYSAIFYGRQYPYENRRLLHLTFNYLQVMTDSSFFSPWKSSFSKVVFEERDESYTSNLGNNYLLFDENIYNYKEFIKEPKFTLNFNDLIYSSLYSPYVSFRKFLSLDSREEFLEKMTTEVGAAVECPFCHRNTIKDSEGFLCSNCSTQLGILPEDDYCEDEDF